MDKKTQLVADLAWLGFFGVVWIGVVPHFRDVTGQWTQFGLYALTFAVLIFCSELWKSYRTQGRILWDRSLWGRIAFFLAVFTAMAAALTLRALSPFTFPIFAVGLLVIIIYQFRHKRPATASAVVWVFMAIAAYSLFRFYK